MLRYSFISWLVVLNRLPTKDRMLRWRVNLDSCCLLCEEELESRDHLFGECPYMIQIWCILLQDCNLLFQCSKWNDLLEWMQCAGRGKSMQAILIGLTWCSLNYYL